MEDFDEASNQITWKTGTIIYKFGDQPDYAFFLKEGEVEIISKTGTTVGLSIRMKFWRNFNPTQYK